MKSGRTKIQVTKSTVEGLFFVDIYIPKVENDGEGAEVIMTHYEDYLHIMFPTQHSPSIVYKPVEDYPYEKLEDELFKEYDVEDWFKREFLTNINKELGLEDEVRYQEYLDNSLTQSKKGEQEK